MSAVENIPELQTAQDVPKDKLASNFQAIIDRGINLMADGADLAKYKGSPYVIDPLGTGPVVNSEMNLWGNIIGGYASDTRLEITAASLQIDASNYLSYTGKTVVFNRTTGQTLTVTGVPEGFVMSGYQKGAGQVTIVAGTGLTLRNLDLHSKSAGQFARWYLEVIDNDLVLAGQTSA